jgi:hypothetical protein
LSPLLSQEDREDIDRFREKQRNMRETLVAGDDSEVDLGKVNDFGMNEEEEEEDQDGEDEKSDSDV